MDHQPYQVIGGGFGTFVSASGASTIDRSIKKANAFFFFQKGCFVLYWAICYYLYRPRITTVFPPSDSSHTNNPHDRSPSLYTVVSESAFPFTKLSLLFRNPHDRSIGRSIHSEWMMIGSEFRPSSVAQ
jgi:hypothetical protein